MKDYNEMAKAVFERRDEYFAARKRKQAMFYKACIPMCALVLVTMVGLLLWNFKTPDLQVAPPEYNKYKDHTVTETENITGTTNNGSVPMGSEGTTPVPPQSEGNSTEQHSQQVSQTNPRPTEQSSQNIPQPTSPIYTPPTKPPTSSDDTNSGDAPATSVPDSTGGNEGDWAEPTDYPHWPVPTDAPVTEAPTAEPTTPRPPFPNDSPTWGGPETESPTTRPNVAPTEPPLEEPTEEPTGPLEVTLNNTTYTAQRGDVVTYTAELQVDKRFQMLTADLEFTGNKLQMIVPAAFANEDYSECAPNMPTAVFMTGKNSIHISALGMFNKIDFCQQKVMLTVDFIVEGSGTTDIDLVISLLQIDEGLYYYQDDQLLKADVVVLKEYLTVTPADEFDTQKPEKPPVQEDETSDFKYPDESTDGDLLMYADGRVYAADIGQKVTCVVELEADRRFESIHVILEYGKDMLELVVPHTDEEDPYAQAITAPNVFDALINYNTFMTPRENDAVSLVGCKVSKYDFRKRKVLLQLEFVVENGGEVDINLFVETMSINGYDVYFELGKPVITEGIKFYTYVDVE